MNLRKTIANWLFKQEYDRLRSVLEDVSSDWQMIPYLQASQPAMLEMLGEFDTHLYDLLVSQIRDYTLVTDSAYNDTFRQSIVKQSRSMYLTDPVNNFAIELWTDYAFGAQPNLTAMREDQPDEQAQALWDEFFTADRNAPVLGERKLHKLSETELVDGELFFAVFASTFDGDATLRTVPTEQILDIVHDPDDVAIPLYYHRAYTRADGERVELYYPDWHATDDQLARAKLPPGAKLADRLNGGTDVVMLHAAFREVNGRGWPLATSGIDWVNEHSRFLKNRAAVARAAATWVEKIKAKGGQRAIDAIKSRLGSSIVGGSDSLESNPPPVAGSTWIENEALSREWMNRPTNAGDAEKDGTQLLAQAGLAFKLYPHYLGRGEVYRLATSTAMEGPTLKSFNRYQTFWSSVWQDMFRIVIEFKNKYGGANLEDITVQVSSDYILDVDPGRITSTSTSLADLFDRGLVDTQTAQVVGTALLRASLTTIGVKSIDEMLNLNKLTTQAEVGKDHHPFDRLSESIEDYRSNLRSPVYGLWSGKIGQGDFVDMMQIAVDTGLRNAWITGLNDIGLAEEDMTDEERVALAEIILAEYFHISGLVDFILQNSKANGGKLDTCISRMGLWVNRWNQVRNQAKVTASSNPPLTWVRPEGGTKEPCEDCLYAAGKTYRASVWRKWGWESPGTIGITACNGYNCLCFFSPGDQYTKLTKGHPRRPIGPK
jgi:hypothetical protein